MAASIPETGYLRIWQIVGRPETETAPAIPALIPVSKSTWWQGCRTGKYPAPIRTLGTRITCWRVEDIVALIEQGREA